MIGSLILVWAAPAIMSTVVPPPGPPKPITRAQFVAKVDAQFAAIDTNHDGKLDKSELAAAQLRSLQQLIIARFKQLDTNHDGQLSLQEFAAGFPTAQVGQVADKVLQQLDTNRDGKLSADEFRAPQLANFEKLDANHDGIVTPDEVRAFQKAHAQPPK